MKKLNLICVSLLLFFATMLVSCNSNSNSKSTENKIDSTSNSIVSGNILSYVTPNLQGSSVLIFNFHATNRCISCNAIEANTKKTIETYFSKEMQEGRVKMMVYNVDDEVNAPIAETFQATGTSLFIVKVVDGKDSIMDLTNDGFKYAKHDPDKLVELLKAKIEENLK